MPNGNQMPGMPIASNNAPPKYAATTEANVTGARSRWGPLRTMRAPITTNNAIDPIRLTLVTFSEWVMAPMISATASTRAATSMLRQGRAYQRFHANVQAATVGTHISFASQE
jgi:hypothetical protein